MYIFAHFLNTKLFDNRLVVLWSLLIFIAITDFNWLQKRDKKY